MIITVTQVSGFVLRTSDMKPVPSEGCRLHKSYIRSFHVKKRLIVMMKNLCFVVCFCSISDSLCVHGY